MFEEWRPILGWPYEVSSLGRVRRGQRVKKSNIRPDGYVGIQLNAKPNFRSTRVHRLVAEAFLPNPDNLPCVNHIDGNKANNHVSNLEWVSHSTNMKHAFAMGLQSHEGESNSNAKITFAIAATIIRRWYAGELQKDLALEFGITQASVSDICRGITWKGLEGLREFSRELRRVGP